MAEHPRDRAAIDVETDHEYDGIREFDNPLPRWWLATFAGTVIFSVGYWFYFHSLGAGSLPAAEFKQEMARAQAAEDARLAQQETQGGGVTDESLAALARESSTVQRGADVFQKNCVVCHGDKGQGVIGPNLTDAYWIHGARLSDCYRIITSGVVDKGMPAWKPVLGLSKIRDVTAYLITLRDTNATGRPPQGVGADGQPAEPPP